MIPQMLKDKRFLPLLVPNFLSALNDNFIRYVFLFFVTYKMTQGSALLIISAVILYALSFSFASVFAGQIADRMSKTKFMQGIRISEIAVMMMALISLSLDSRWLLVLIVASMGSVAAFLRVGNNSILPVIVTEKNLNMGNVWLKIASTLGALAAVGFLTSILKFDAAYYVVMFVAFALSIVGFLITLKLPMTDAADSEAPLYKNPTKAFGAVADYLKNKYDIWLYIVGISWFWILATVVAVFSAEYGRAVLNARWSVVMYLSSVFGIGYIIGAFLYAKVTHKNNIGTWTALVSFLISLFMFDLIIASTDVVHDPSQKAITVAKMFTTDFDYWRIMVDVLVLGGLSAFFIIPFYVLLQIKSAHKMLGRVMAFSSMVNAIAVVGAFLVVLSFRSLGFDLLTVLALFAAFNLLMAVYMIRLLPLASRRQLFKKIFRTLFNARVEGLENLAIAGPRALIIPNHSSYLDVLLISAFIDKKILLAIDEKLMQRPFIKFMTNLVDVKPMDAVSPFAVKEMSEELKKDQLCMILTEGFIEGGNTRMKIYEAPALMAVKGNAPILPIRIDGAKHAIFSRVLKNKADFRWFPEVSINILEPVSFEYDDKLTTREIREQSSSKLYDVMFDMVFDSYKTDMSIFTAIARSMKMAGRFKPVMEDTARHPVRFMGVFLKSFVLGALINRAIPDDKYVGVMVPTSNTCALTVFGLQAYNKVPCMINFSSGPKQVIATCKTVGLKTVVTAKKVVMLAKLEPLVEEIKAAGINILYLEDLKDLLKFSDKLFGIWGAFCPESAYKKTSGGKVKGSDTAVVLFTSGSEGMPKAVFLSHSNILSNCYQVPSRFDVFPNDVFLNCLPMFHSFGLGAGTILPLLMGVKTFLYPTPLHYRIIPEICASVKATIFFGTDTFLAGYAKCANPYDFNSLRIVAVGAEKLKDETRKIWSEKFGVRILEGYGATECSPFISVNTFLHQKIGSVGRLLPGITYDLREVPGIKEGKELLVKGPNIMQGYMRYEKPLELDPPKDGWYDTGDIVEIDKDGFIFIKGRSKRFAKVGGEMVSLLSVETVIQKKWPGVIAGAVNIPDKKKGEQIVLITTSKDINKEELISAFKAAGVTELGIPSKIIVTDNPPLLGTGKFDYVRAKELANAEVNG